MGSTDKTPKEEGKEVNPLDLYIREEMYPGLSDDVIEKLQNPEKGLPEGAY